MKDERDRYTKRAFKKQPKGGRDVMIDPRNLCQNRQPCLNDFAILLKQQQN